MTTSATINSLKPFYRELKAGQRVLWCACGLSKRQPFCDGRSHIGTGIEPVAYQAPTDEEVLFCGCKQSCAAPFCDGSHNNLPDGYQEVTEQAGNVERPYVDPDDQGFARLNGSCYVVSPRHPDDTATYSCITLVSSSMGSKHQSQFHIRLKSGRSPILSSSVGDIVLWIRDGLGTVDIGPRSFDIEGRCGVAIRQGETFQLTAGESPLDVYVSLCPGANELAVDDALSGEFEERWPDRVVRVNEEERQSMGPRWFQTLVDERYGLQNTVQFVGHIPRSRAEMHRHLYEEALIILSGGGTIWNETLCARVQPGDVIFFPRKHIHTLQCTVDEGMDVVGLIHPGTNPGVNY